VEFITDSNEVERQCLPVDAELADENRVDALSVYNIAAKLETEYV